jgi:MFS family permease
VRRRTVLAEALRRPALRRLCLVSTLFHVAEFGTWIAVTTVAHGRGGVNEASAVVAAQLAPAALAALFVGRLEERWGPTRVLVAGLSAQATATIALAALVAADAPSLAVYGAAVLAAIAVVTSRPTIAALLVRTVEDPHELTAANAVLGWLDNSAIFVGPAITSLGFALAGPETPFTIFGVLTVLAALAATRLRDVAPLDPGALPSAEDEDVVEAASTWRDIGPPLAVLAAHSFVIGALDLLFVLVAIDITGGPPARAGLLNTFFGVGALLGAGASVLLIGRSRLWPAVIGAGLITTTALGFVGASTVAAFAALALAVCGVGSAGLSISARTLLQRLSDMGVLCRAFSLAEAAEMAMLLAGTLAVPLFVAVIGDRAAPLGIALVAAVVILLAGRPMAAAEHRLAVPLERLTALRAAELFRPLDAPSLETLARSAVPRSVAQGTTILRQGDDGDDYFVIVAGRVSVVIDGEVVAELGPEQGFGELALLYDIPRTATIEALEPTDLLAIDRHSFLVAVSGSPVAASATYEYQQTGGDPA